MGGRSFFYAGASVKQPPQRIEHPPFENERVVSPKPSLLSSSDRTLVLSNPASAAGVLGRTSPINAPERAASFNLPAAFAVSSPIRIPK